MAKCRRGFTLIELLVVILILGILVAIAIVRFTAVKEKSLVATMTSDLRNLATAQETYLSEYAAYYGGTIPSSALAHRPSPGVTVVMDGATVSGWAATASSTGTTRQCQIFFGASGPNGVATVEGRVTCTP